LLEVNLFSLPEFTYFLIDILTFSDLSPCVTKGNLPAMPTAGKPAGRMEKWKEGKVKGSLGFLPFFPAFPFFLRQSQDKSLVLYLRVIRL
jgi:hypothetical protein